MNILITNLYFLEDSVTRAGVWGAVYIILEWLSFWYEFHCRMNNRLAQLKKASGCFRSQAFCARSDMHAPLSPKATWFSIWNKVRFQFTWYQNEISYQIENFIGIESQNELITEWLVYALEWNVILISIMQTIQKNVGRWNELVPEWKSLGYHVPWLAGLVKRMTVSASGDGLSASSFSSSSSPPSASVFWKCESNIIGFLLLHVRLLWKAGLWNSPQFFLPAQLY